MTAIRSEAQVHEEERTNPRILPQRVYVCSPLRGRYGENVRLAKLYSRFVALTYGLCPVTPHLLYPRFLDDTSPREREMGLAFGRSLLRCCDEVWVFGQRISEGMAQEIAEAGRLGIRVRHVPLADLCEFVRGERGRTPPGLYDGEKEENGKEETAYEEKANGRLLRPGMVPAL